MVKRCDMKEEEQEQHEGYSLDTLEERRLVRGSALILDLVMPSGAVRVSSRAVGGCCSNA